MKTKIKDKQKLLEYVRDMQSKYTELSTSTESIYDRISRISKRVYEDYLAEEDKRTGEKSFLDLSE